MINQTIISARKSAAAKLTEIISQAEQGVAALSNLEQASAAVEGNKHSLLESLSKTRNDLLALIGRARLREQRFLSGLITVAVGGIEKSGKTTMLKALTGIEELPTAMARCTAVCCEIVYSESRNDFDLEFHSEHEFCLQVLQPLIERFNASQSETRIDALPTSLEDFRRLVLPTPTGFISGTDPAIQLHQLRSLHSYVEEVRRHLGKPPQRNLPLEQLNSWTANSEDPVLSVRISTVARCTIHTKFHGGSPNLRWIDTPGVDDPSPLARNRTLQTISRETDLLVVATMPGDKPSPTKAFTDFWTSINQITDEVKLLDRLLILLNWNKTSDPTGLGIRDHHRFLREGKPDIFCGPLEANNAGDLICFVDRVNQHLATNLPLQDAQVIDHLYNSLRSIQATIRQDVFDKARQLNIGDPSSASAEYRLFEAWFLETPNDGRPTGFWPSLGENFNNTADALPKSEEIRRASDQLDRLFKDEAKKIMDGLPTAEAMDAYNRQTSGENPIIHYLKHLASGEFSNLANLLSEQVESFGPIIQRAVLEILRKSGLGPLLDLPSVGNDPERLHRRLQEHDSPENLVLKALKQLASLHSTVQYVYRWEMRPAINFLHPLDWEKRSKPGLEELFKQTNRKKDAEELREVFKGSLNDSGGRTSSENLKLLCQFALKGIHAVLSSDRCNFGKIADDLIRENLLRLAVSPQSNQAWRNLLRNEAAVLVGEKISLLRSNSERLRTFRNALDALSACLP